LFLPSNHTNAITSEDKFIEIRNSRIRFKFIQRSSEVNLIFLHSFGGSLEMWDSLSSYFKNENILSYDLIGFGKSDKPDIEYSLNTQVNYLNALVDSLKIKKCILIGSSMGASISIWAASKYPEKYKKIIAFAPSGFPGSMNHDWPGNLFYRPGILNKIGSVITRTSLFNFLFPNSLGRQTFNITSSYDDSFVNAVTKVNQLVQLLWSRSDKRSLFSYSEKYLKLMRNSSLYELPSEAKHKGPGFQPEETSKIITEFIYK
jgi:pimeloyl-ACP methyl ester carboxylesterase